MGGGIYNAGLSTIVDTTIDSNATGRGGVGGTGGRGAGATAGDGTVSNPGTPAGTGGAGGAGGNEGAVYGNGVNNDPVLALASGGGGIANSAAGRITLTGSTVSNNHTGAGGNGGDNADASLGSGNGGFGGYGGAIWTSEDTQNGVQAVVTMTNLTIAANLLGAGGTPGSDPRFVGLPGGRGLGAAMVIWPGSTLTETNTLVATNGARNLGDTNCADSLAQITNGGGNLNFSGSISIPDTTCPGINADPVLGALTANGGPTLTMLPAVGSPALNVDSCAETTDQRGEPRPEVGNSACDIGAVERQPVENGGTSDTGGTTGSGGTTSTGGTTGSGGTTGTGSTATPAVTTRPSIVFGRIRSSGATVTIVLTCRGALGATCTLKLKLSAVATYRGTRLIGFAPKQTGRGNTRRKIVSLDAATVTLRSGPSRSVTLILDGLGRRQLALQQELNASLIATQGSGAQTTTLLSHKLPLRAK